jgi:ArsR family transcriptional regulator, arsenate/arsenite/antimonite-responsive transcriptional repressor
MNEKQAVKALSALAQETRLEIFRLLVEKGPNGLPAGEIGESLRVAPATLSFHLKELEQGGLLNSRRVSRKIFYATNYEGMGILMNYLSEDCCKCDPRVCVPTQAAAEV